MKTHKYRKCANMYVLLVSLNLSIFLKKGDQKDQCEFDISFFITPKLLLHSGLRELPTLYLAF